MSRSAALIISLALTVLTLLTGLGLGLRVMAAQPDAGSPAQQAAPDDAVVADALPASELQEYVTRLQQSNEALSASYARIASLRDDVQRLQAQNALLREREALDRERLAEATQVLQRQGSGTIAPLLPTTASAAASRVAEPAARSTRAEARPSVERSVVNLKRDDDRAERKVARNESSQKRDRDDDDDD